MMDDNDDRLFSRFFKMMVIVAPIIWVAVIGVVIWAIVMLVNHFAG